MPWRGVSTVEIHLRNSASVLTGVGGIGREEDDSRVDNVICRTPARNAQNLELVKSEILEMVDRVVSSYDHD